MLGGNIVTVDRLYEVQKELALVRPRVYRALDPDALEDTISRSVSIPNCLTYLLLDGVPLNAAYRELAAGLPEGKYSRFIQNVGVVVRRPSDFMSGLEYVAIEDRENVMPESGRILQMLLLLLAAATLGMGVVAFLATTNT